MPELLRRAGLLVARGESVILDASWTDERWRSAAADLARQTWAVFLPLQSRADARTSEERIRTRAPNPSDATPEVAREMAARTSAWPGAVTVRTVGEVQGSFGQIATTAG